MKFGQKGVSGLVLLTVISFLILLGIVINYFILPLEYLPYLIPNQIRQQQFKEENRKVAEKAKKENSLYQSFKNSGVVIKPSYLPPSLGKPVEEKRLEMVVNSNTVFGHEIDYTCNQTPASLVIKYIPFSAETLRINKELQYFKTDQFIQSLINEGNMAFQEITVNNSSAYFNTYSRSWRPYDTILAWETDKVIVQIWKYPDCQLSKEELIKIAKSIK